ncbi:MAG: minor capsid protein [Planctomycetota bacterium]
MSLFESPDDARDAQRELFDETIERATEIERFKAGLILALLRSWRPAERAIVTRTRDRFEVIRNRGTLALAQQNVQGLLARQRDIIDQAAGSLQSQVRSDLLEFVSLQDEWQRATFSGVLPSLNLGPELPASLRREIVNARPFEGRNLADWFRGFREATKRVVNQQTVLAFQAGETAPQVVQRLSRQRGEAGALHRSRTEIETLAQTAVQQIANEVQAENLRKLRGLFTHEVWVATLDSNVCITCASLDGKRFPVDEGPQWPIHPRCRCRRVPEVPGAGSGRRASSEGQIPGDVKLSDWLLTQSPERQNRILGRTRADLFRAGRLPDLDPMTLLDPQFRPIRLDELNRRLRRVNPNNN